MKLIARGRLLVAALSIAAHQSSAVCSAIAESRAVESPVSPADSLKYLVLPSGLKAELVAHEPDVIDPVAVRFDEVGRMWVVEMRDYPTAGAKGNQARSRISVLRDRDGDGFFETSRVFADDLPYATGVQPWKGGVFVTMAGQVAYIKDNDGDDRADLVETWYTGFAEKNTQLRANHPRLALDGHIYVANGLRGGEIVDAKRPSAKPLSISGMDFRFEPRTRNFEAVTGVGQFGLTFDDFGNRFVCSNRNPVIHIVLEDRHVKKNPLFAPSAVSTDVAKAGAESKVFPITRAWTTSHLHAGQFTAACGVEIYRGDALPADYYGNVFVCEPTGHLVHREIMKPYGVTFSSTAAEDGVEFLASRDEWWSPVNLEVGPDGALYVVDMYRAVIEHPHWMPAELRDRPDLTHGNDRGRIYRIVPEKFSRPAAPQLSSVSSESLVELLAHPNAWWRETAARLLMERGDTSVSGQLKQVALGHGSHVARIHAMWLLRCLKQVEDTLLARLLVDPNPRVVEQAILAAEPRIARSNTLRDSISKLVDHADARVRFQALLVATPLPPAPTHSADRWEVDAMLIAAGRRSGTALSALLQNPAALSASVDNPKRLVADLARIAAASDAEEQSRAIEALVASSEFGRAGLAGLFDQTSQDGSTDSVRATLDAGLRADLDRMFEEACADATDSEKNEQLRGEAVDLLAFSDEMSDTLLSVALDEPNQYVRLRAIAALAKRREAQPWREVLTDFSAETPAVQRAILAGIFASGDRTSLLLDEIEAGRIKPTELDASRTRLLVDHKDAAIKARAAKLLAEALPADREQALLEYQAVLTMTADAARGRRVFEKHCATCHQIDGVGVSIAPDISDSREKSAEQLLTDIVQPNRAIDSNYFGYTAVTVDGLVHTGVLAAETSTSVTLKQAEGKTVTLLREQIEELRSDGVSYMPDGIEKNIPPQDMANLIAFIKNWRYLEPQPSVSGGP